MIDRHRRPANARRGIAWLLAAALVTTACSAASSSTAPAPSIALGERQIDLLEMPGDPDWLTAGFGAVWVKRDDGNVVRIDPATHELVATIDADVTNPGLCQGIGTDGTSVWACSGPDIVRIDPASNEVADVVEAGKIYAQGRLVHQAGRIWILTGENAEQLVGVDTATLAVGSPIDLGAACWDLAAGGGAVWAACPPDGVVVRVDPAAGVVTDRFEIEGPMQVTFGAGALWVAVETGLVRLDPDDGSTTTIGMVPGPKDEGGVWADDDSVWVRARKPFLTRIDAATSRIVETIVAPERGLGDVIGLDGSLWATDYVEGAVVHLRTDD